MLGVEAVVVLEYCDGKRWLRIWVRRAGDAEAVKLAPACSDADLLGRVGDAGCGELGCTQLGMDEPDSLRQEGQE